jgi:hypothetical protein
MKKEYDKKTKNGWIDKQFLLRGNYLEKEEYGKDYILYIVNNNIILLLRKEDIIIIKELIKEFEKQEGIFKIKKSKNGN